MTVQENHPVRALPLHDAPDGADLPVAPQPASREPAPRLECPLSAKVPNVQGVALVRGRLLVKAVPVAAP